LRAISAITFATHTVALLILAFFLSNTGLWLFVIFYGIGNGAITLARAALIADAYGAASYGAISGAMAIFIALTQAIAPLGAGLLHDYSGSYRVVILTLATASMIAALAVYKAQNSS